MSQAQQIAGAQHSSAISVHRDLGNDAVRDIISQKERGNLINVFFSTTGGVGELSNFIIGAVFVFTAGMMYKKKKRRSDARLGAVDGSFIMAGMSLISNFYLVYPL